MIWTKALFNLFFSQFVKSIFILTICSVFLKKFPNTNKYKYPKKATHLKLHFLSEKTSLLVVNCGLNVEAEFDLTSVNAGIAFWLSRNFGEKVYLPVSIFDRIILLAPKMCPKYSLKVNKKRLSFINQIKRFIDVKLLFANILF